MKLIAVVSEEKLSIQEAILQYCKEENIDVEMKLINHSNEVGVYQEVVEKIQGDLENTRAVVVDDYGIIPFMITAKHAGIICAQLSDEHSGFMTRDHNNSNIICMGHQIIGEAVILSIIKRFVEHDYAGGRHQIRVDMLNSMGVK